MINKCSCSFTQQTFIRGLWCQVVWRTGHTTTVPAMIADSRWGRGGQTLKSPVCGLGGLQRAGLSVGGCGQMAQVRESVLHYYYGLPETPSSLWSVLSFSSSPLVGEE